MKTLPFIATFTMLLACAPKSTHDLLLGEWNLTSWKTTNKYTNFKEKEMIDSPQIVLFEKDSVHITETNKTETYHYFISGDSLIIPYALGGILQIKLLDKKDLHLYTEQSYSLVSEGENDERMHSESRIELKKQPKTNP